MKPTQEHLHEILMSLVAPGHEAAAEAIVTPGLEQLESGAMTADDIDQAVAAMTPLVKPDKVGKLEHIAADIKRGLDEVPGEPGMRHALMSLVAPGNEAAAEAIVDPGLAQLASGTMTADDVDQAVAAMAPLVSPDKIGKLERIAADVKARLG